MAEFPLPEVIHGTLCTVHRIELGRFRQNWNSVELRRQAMYWLSGEGRSFKVRVTYASYGNPAFGPSLSNVYCASHYNGAFEFLRRLLCLTSVRQNVEIREEWIPEEGPGNFGVCRETSESHR